MLRAGCAIILVLTNTINKSRNKRQKNFNKIMYSANNQLLLIEVIPIYSDNNMLPL